MPSLGNYDPKTAELASKEDVNAARRLAETVIRVSGYQVQFDNISRQRMKDVICSMGEDQVNWKMYDNKVVAFFKSDLADLFHKAEAAMGAHSLKVFQRAASLKDQIDNGEVVTMADLRLARWSY